MIDYVTVLSNIIAGIILSIIVFLFTHSKYGIKIMSRIKEKINVSYEEIEREKKYQSEIETQEGNVKKVSSKLYNEPKQFDINTFFTIKSSDLDRFDIIRFIIKEKVDQNNIYFDIKTSLLKKHTPSEYLKAVDKKVQIYIRRLKGEKEFTIERLGRAIDSLPVTKYKKNDTN